MVEVLFSRRYSDIYYIRYSKETNSHEDDQHLTLLSEFSQNYRKFTMVIETLPGTSVTDKAWFENTEIKHSSIHQSLNKVIAFGQVGVQLTFMRKYLDLLEEQGIETQVLKNRDEFKSKYDISVEADFYQVFQYPK